MFDVEENKLTEFLTLLLKNRLDKKIRQDGRHVSRYFLILLRNWLAANSHNVQLHFFADSIELVPLQALDVVVPGISVAAGIDLEWVLQKAVEDLLTRGRCIAG